MLHMRLFSLKLKAHPLDFEKWPSKPQPIILEIEFIGFCSVCISIGFKTLGLKPSRIQPSLNSSDPDGLLAISTASCFIISGNLPLVIRRLRSQKNKNYKLKKQKAESPPGID